MRKYILILLSFLLFSASILAQVPFAFRYQASVRDTKNKPVLEEVQFDILLFADADATNEIYSESHVIKPDTNGLVAFSIGEGLTNDDFSSIVWAEGPYYIQVLLDGEEISFSQLISVPYAMHAQTANKLHNLQDPILSNDPTTKSYVDKTITEQADSLNYKLSDLDYRLDSINTELNTNVNVLNSSTAQSVLEAVNTSKAYTDSLSIAPKNLEVTSSGDTLKIGGTAIYIPGLSSENMPKYAQQLVLGGSYNESLIKVNHCQDSSLILMCMTQSGNGDIQDFKGDADIWIIKLSPSLNVEWTKTIGGSRYDNAAIMLEEPDGYLIGGTTESNDGDITKLNGEFDIWLVKIDNTGNILWQKTYGGAGTEFLNAVIPIDNGYYIGATTFSNGGDISYLNGESDIWIFKLNENHEISKTISIGGSSYDALNTMTFKNNELVLYGTSSSNDGHILKNQGALDFITIKLNLNLEITEQKCYGKSTNEQLQYVNTTTNGTLLAGCSFAENWSIGTGNALKNIYLEHTGSSPWEKQYGGSSSDILCDVMVQNDTITLLAQTSSQNGDITTSKGASDIWLLELSPEGKILKNKAIGGTYDETPKVIKALAHGGWLIGAESESFNGNLTENAGGKDIWLVKVDHNFDIVWQKTFGGSYNETLKDIIIIDDHNVIICGTTSSNDYSINGLHDKAGKSNDIWILKTTIE